MYITNVVLLYSFVEGNMATPTDETYGALQEAYNFFNKRLFRGKLAPCMFTLTRNPCTAGYFLARRWARMDEKTASVDEISINPLYFKKLGIQEALQTLVHEMCHCWQHHYGKPTRGGYHNAEWAKKMQQVGLMPSDTGRPGGKKTGQGIRDYAIEGGVFLKAVDELMSQGFQIKWHDQMLELMDEDIGNDDEELFEGVNTASQGTSNNVVSLFQDIQNLVNGPRTPGHAVGGRGRSVPKTKPGQRVKFQCEECGLNAWAKASARLRCDDCDCTLEPATSKRRSPWLQDLLHRAELFADA